MGKTKNEISILEQAKAGVALESSNLEQALNARLGGSAIQTAKDSDGKDYVTATFKLATPTKKFSELVVNDVDTMQRLERMRRAQALGDVATFELCKEIRDFGDNVAGSLGFDGTTELVQAFLGVAKSTVANYKRIGEYFLEQGDKIEIKGAIPKNTPISMLNQLLSLVKKEDSTGTPDIRNVETLFKYGLLTPYMKQKDYKAIISTLNAMETTKELKDMTEQEIEELKKRLADVLNTERAKKKQEQENKKQEQAGEQEQEQESNDPKVIIGQALNMIHTLQERAKALEFSQEQAELVNTWLDNLYITYTELLG